MFYYYGSKKQIIKHYPRPLHDTIIEPFAGAAAYSCHHTNWQKNIILVDKYDKIIEAWKYLISANKKDILNLPDLFKGDNLKNYNQLSDQEKILIGFCINPGSTKGGKTVTTFGENSWNRKKRIISENVHKCNHWEIIHGSYKTLKNINATWFIDPPYYNGGCHYKYSDIDYNDLSKWCKSRNGQAIACENESGNWLDFKKLKRYFGAQKQTVECIWTNNSGPHLNRAI